MIAAAFEHAARLLGGTSVHWLCEPHSPRQRIYFGNHTSHLDFLAIWSALPHAHRRTVRPVAGRDYWVRDPLRRYVATAVFNAILIDRHSASVSAASSPSVLAASADARATTEYIARAMGADHSIIVFPEGTRSRAGDVHAFKSGLYFLSKLRPDAEFIPVHLENLHRILPKGESIPVPMLSRVVFGPRLDVSANEEKAAFLEHARQAVISLGRAS